MLRILVAALMLAVSAAAFAASAAEEDNAEALEATRREQNERAIQERSERLQAEARAQTAAIDAARRAQALQLLQSGAFRVQPNLIDPNLFPALRPSTTCTSQVIGSQIQTVCR